MDIHPLESGWTPLEALLINLDEEGKPTWGYRTTRRLNLEELLGVTIHVEVLKLDVMSGWESE